MTTNAEYFDLARWAETVSNYLRPGGKFIMVEFHPVVWMFDEAFEKIGYNYFNTGPIVESETGDYADRNALIGYPFAGWNHGIGEILNSLIAHGLEINSFEEFDYSPYNCFRDTLEVESGKFRIKHLEGKIPMLYAITATKKELT